MRYYLAHPRSGNTYANIMEANKIAQNLEHLNLIEPFKEIPQDGSVGEFEAMERCIKLLLEADALILSGDYQFSEGCQLEKEIAKKTGKPIYVYRYGGIERI